MQIPKRTRTPLPTKEQANEVDFENGGNRDELRDQTLTKKDSKQNSIVSLAKIHNLFQISYFFEFYLFHRIFLPSESPLAPLHFKFVSDLRPNFASPFPGLCIFFVLLSGMQPKEN
ncbi:MULTISPECIES: hypothetical protein [unclassified Alistipes]|uniref:hypothetical protein n=2 Tax=Alistipes TaxID=239759 RepID=UPI001D9A6B6E|nr:hypothetical protein [uncultured Alistipes sp.]MBD9137811.1 hypothetical protein [Alistipes shahii]